MTEQGTIDGMSALAWLWAVFAVVILASGIASPRTGRNLTRRADRPSGAGVAQAELGLRFARGARTAEDDRWHPADLGAVRA